MLYRTQHVRTYTKQGACAVHPTLSPWRTVVRTSHPYLAATRVRHSLSAGSRNTHATCTRVWAADALASNRPHRLCPASGPHVPVLRSAGGVAMTSIMLLCVLLTTLYSMRLVSHR